MIEDEDRAAGPRAGPEDVQPPAANDNGNAEARPRIDAAVLRIAQMAREEFERLSAANDNRPPERHED